MAKDIEDKSDDFMKLKILASGVERWLMRSTTNVPEGMAVLAIVTAAVMAQYPDQAGDVDRINDFNDDVLNYLNQMRKIGVANHDR